MTLTALRKGESGELTLAFPHKEVIQGAKRDIVVDLYRSGTYICPHCYAKSGKEYKVRLRAADDRRLHFFHLRSDKHHCKNFNAESEKHQVMKQVLMEAFTKEGFTCELETSLPKSGSASKRRRPDLTLHNPARSEVIAIEVQISRISWDEFYARVRDHAACGCDRTIWYFGHMAYNGEAGRKIRQWLATARIPFFKAGFKNGNPDEWWIERGSPAGKEAKANRTASRTPNATGADGCEFAQYVPSIIPVVESAPSVELHALYAPGEVVYARASESEEWVSGYTYDMSAYNQSNGLLLHKLKSPPDSLGREGVTYRLNSCVCRDPEEFVMSPGGFSSGS